MWTRKEAYSKLCGMGLRSRGIHFRRDDAVIRA
ncbi:hypothetical protein [Pseudoramibacter faecis]